ncbi:MAG: hypothetical protein ACRDM7_13695 [Thermoleophilaceae bacterium]
MSERPPARALIGIALLAGATLALQVVITRILAAVLSLALGAGLWLRRPPS